MLLLLCLMYLQRLHLMCHLVYSQFWHRGIKGGKETLISVIFTWFLLSSYLLKLLVFLYFFWFDFYLYLSIHLCFEWMRRFQINLQGLYMQSGARLIESSQLTSSQAWIQEKTNPIKFKSNWSKESKEICTKSKSNSD